MIERVVVIGTGYVGLTTGVCLSHLGFDVRCVDNDKSKIDRLAAGQLTIFEAGMQELLLDGLRNGRLAFELGSDVDLSTASIVFLCLPTPSAEDGSADLSHIARAIWEYGPRVPSGCVVVTKSTVPVGSVDIVAEMLGRDDISVVSNPEFLREGSAVADFLEPDRVVLGSNDRVAAERVARLYEQIGAPIVVTDPRSAEISKYASNLYLAMRVSFANSIATLSEAVGANVRHVLDAVGLDHRIGSSALVPGPGWGGSCFGKDIRALRRTAEDVGFDFPLARMVVEVNEEQFVRVADMVESSVGGSVDGRKLAVWGLTFKAGTDDLRESPSLRVIDILRTRGAKVVAFDPVVSKPLADRPDVILTSDKYEAIDDAEALVVLTEWNEFAHCDLDLVAGRMANPVVVDARNILDREALDRAGFHWSGIGNA